MASINRLRKELLFKIVFYGPGLGGKTTTLQYVHRTTRQENRGNMVSLATDTDRTLYFDYLPVKLLKLGDMTVKLQLYTVPGQVYYGATRKLVLNGADGIVFVADSQSARLDANTESLDDLNANLAEQGRKLSSMPHAFEWNKRDLPDLVAVEELDRRLNLFGAPSVPTTATTGDGVFELLEKVTRLVVEGYRADLPPGGMRIEGTPLFLDAEDVGLSGAIRDLADSRPARSPSTGRRGLGQEPVRSPAPIETAAAQAHAGRSPAPASAAAGAQNTPPLAPDHLTTPAPPMSAGPFSLAEVWPSSDRDTVRRAELALAARDTVSAVAVCDDLLSRVLAAGSLLLGGAGATASQATTSRDPAVVVLLLRLDGPRYLSFRAVTRAVRAKREPTILEALECYTFVVEARQALDRAASGASGR
jgi:signal recognition particle receptor subunit beta